MIVGLPDIGQEARDLVHFLVSLVCPAGRDEAGLSQARLIGLPDFADDVLAEDAWGHEALRLLRLALDTLQAGRSLNEFDEALR